MTHLKEINYDKSEYVKLLSQVIEKAKEYKEKRADQIAAWKKDDVAIQDQIDRLWDHCYTYWKKLQEQDDEIWDDDCYDTWPRRVRSSQYNSLLSFGSWQPTTKIKYETKVKETTKTRRVLRDKPIGFIEWLFTFDSGYVTETYVERLEYRTGKKESKAEHRARLEKELDIPVGEVSKYEELVSVNRQLPGCFLRERLFSYTHNKHVDFLKDTEKDLKRVLASAYANYTIDSSQFVKYTKYLTDDVSVD